MFLVYVNDLLLLVQSEAAYGYADDFKILASSLEQANDFAQKISNWIDENLMKPSIDKNKILCVKRHFPDKHNVIKIVSTHKDSGVTLSPRSRERKFLPSPSLYDSILRCIYHIPI